MKAAIDIIRLNIKMRIIELRMPQKEFYQKIGKTRSGFEYGLDNGSLKIKDLEKVAEVLGVDITFFFKENNDKTPRRTACAECDKKDKQIQLQEVAIASLQKNMELYEELRRSEPEQNSKKRKTA